MSGQQRMTVYLAAIIGVTIFSVVVGSMLAFNQCAAWLMHYCTGR